MNVEIISSGSSGNAIFLNDEILIDCGVSFSKIKHILGNIKVVLLTHCHSDHFNKKTIEKIAKERPSIYFVCGEWLEIADIVGVSNVLILEKNFIADFSEFSLKLEEIPHNVRNCCWHIFYKNEKCFYATDTNDLSHILAKDYDLYLVEANHTQLGIKKRIKDKFISGEYCYEKDAILNHMSKEKIDDWLVLNASYKSKYIYLHINENEKEFILEGS